MNDGISTFDTPQQCGDAIAQLKQTSPDCFQFIPDQLFDSKKWVISVYVRTVPKSDVIVRDASGREAPYLKFSHFA